MCRLAWITTSKALDTCDRSASCDAYNSELGGNLRCELLSSVTGSYPTLYLSGIK